MRRALQPSYFERAAATKRREEARHVVAEKLEQSIRIGFTIPGWGKYLSVEFYGFKGRFAQVIIGGRRSAMPIKAFVDLAIVWIVAGSIARFFRAGEAFDGDPLDQWRDLA